MFHCHLILFKFLYFYICGRWHFSTLVMWPSIGDVLCDPSCSPRARDQLVQGRFWPVFADSVPQVPWLLFTCFWCLPPGRWGWVSAVCGLSRGGCGLRKALGSFSVDWWGCVLTLRWFGLRHPSIGAYGLLGGAISANEPSKRSTCSRSSYR